MSKARATATAPPEPVPAGTIPAFVNPRGGSADAARAAIHADARFALREVDPDALGAAMGAAAAAGHRRVLVSGGDGTVAAAAAVAATSGQELAVLPGGTLNHFAVDLGLPAGDAGACLTAAVEGEARPADLAYVNDHAILNTSAVGAYVTFVRTRERFERWSGYRLASMLAAGRTWAGLHGFSVTVREGGRDGDPMREYAESPLVFLGVGERDFTAAAHGARVPNGVRALHVVVVRAATRARVLALAARAAVEGLESVAAQSDAVDVALVDACEIRLRRPRGRVAIDGELVPMTAPLRYRIARHAFLAVGPLAASGGAGARG
ncbi:MAG TPA: diacylglycerol kinase family protein [Gemmatirosa sp.]